jgi:replicative DNA helicase
MIKEIPDITEPVEVFGFATARELVNQTLQVTPNAAQYSAYEEPNIPSGFQNIDNITKGFRRGELTTIGTRPGNGKTAFLLSLVQNMAISLERHVALFSPERSAQKVIRRLIESNTSHSVEKIRQGLLKEWDKAHTDSLIQRIASANLFIDDTTNLDAHELLLRCHQVKQKYQAEVIFVDSPESYTAHFQDPATRINAAEELIQTLATVAKELDIPVVCFTQIGKPVAMVNGGFTPSIDELPTYMAVNSGTVIFIHRPEYYNMPTRDLPKGAVELIFNKHNNTIVQERTFLKFIESIDTFVDP